MLVNMMWNYFNPILVVTSIPEVMITMMFFCMYQCLSLCSLSVHANKQTTIVPSDVEFKYQVPKYLDEHIVVRISISKETVNDVSTIIDLSYDGNILFYVL